MARSSTATNKSGTLTIRLNPELRKRMDAVASSGPYPVSLTAIVERGIVLATEEIERMHASLKGQQP